MLGVKEQTNDVKKCMVCDKTFHTAVTLKRHNREVHKLLPEEGEVQKEDGVFNYTKNFIGSSSTTTTH